MRLRCGDVFAVLLLLLAIAVAKDFRPPPPQPAATYPAHETHPHEHLTIAADPYDTPLKLEGAKVHYREQEILPIRLIITNDGDTPMSLRDLRVQLITAKRSKLEPATRDDILRRIAGPTRRPDQTSRSSPFPFPRRNPQRVHIDQQNEVEDLLFRARAVEAHATQSGFFFFDTEGLDAPLSGARLYLTGIADANGNELMYFEIPLDKYLSAPHQP